MTLKHLRVLATAHEEQVLEQVCEALPRCPAVHQHCSVMLCAWLRFYPGVTGVMIAALFLYF